MSTPHDYYEYGPHDHRDPHLHNRGENRPYLEPDYFANHHDGALPVLSTIGRGPKGYGIKFHKDDLGNLIIDSDDPMQDSVTYHLGDWNIWVTQKANGEIVEGQNTEFDIHISDGTNVKKKTIIVPCGSQGSRVYFGDGGPYEYREDNTYQVGSIIIYPGGTPHEIRFPVPRTGDLVVFEVVDYPEYPNNQVAIGTIEAIDEEHGYVVAYAPVLYPVAVVDYNDLMNRPSLNGVPLVGNVNTGDLNISYVDAQDKPKINNVELVGNKTTADLGLFSGDYDDLSNKPVLFNGDYLQLSNKPRIGETGAYHDIEGDLDLFDDLAVPYCHTWAEWDPSTATSTYPIAAYEAGGSEWLWPLNYNPSGEMYKAAHSYRTISQQTPFSDASYMDERIDFTFNYQCKFYEDADWSDVLEVIADHGSWVTIIGMDFGSIYVGNAITTGSAFFTTSDGNIIACPIRMKIRDGQTFYHPWVCEVGLPTNPQIVSSFTGVFISGTVTATPLH